MASGERAELAGVLVDGRYRVGRRIAVGGTGVVFAAHDMVHGIDVVLKTLRPMFVGNADLVRRLRREAEVARFVHHPGLIPVLHEGTLPDASPYLIFHKACGESLSRLLCRYGRLELAEAAVLVLRVADILHAAHRQGYVHRDVKPEHVILEPASHGDLRVQLLDFGVCAAASAPPDERAREKGRVYGTPSYVSPEQARGVPDVDARADVFSLGILLYETLTGELPFRADNVTNLLRRIIREDAPRLATALPGLSSRLDATLARALARSPEDRYPNARAFAHAMVPFIGSRRLAERNVVARTEMSGISLDSPAPVVRTTAITAVAA